MVIQKEKIIVDQDKTKKLPKKQQKCRKKIKDCMNCRILNCPEEET